MTRSVVVLFGEYECRGILLAPRTTPKRKSLWSLDERAEAFPRVQFYHFVDNDGKNIKKDVLRKNNFRYLLRQSLDSRECLSTESVSLVLETPSSNARQNLVGLWSLNMPLSEAWAQTCVDDVDIASTCQTREFFRLLCG